MKLKLDLHTHCFEATGQRWLDVGVVERIVSQIKARGLDGIAVTEHDYKSYAFQFKEIVEKHFNGQVLIIPGQEISLWPAEIAELYLPNNLVFRFIVHPGYPPTDYSRRIDRVQGIEIDNALHNYQMDKKKIKRLAEEHDLLMLSNSDAHSVEDIGRFYNEVSLEELCARARPASEEKL
ncbi:MAG: PHP domain-containing protein [Dehalococcoidia bacterium]